MLLEYKILSNQTLSDVCMATYNSMELLFKLVTDNPILNLDVDMDTVLGEIIYYDSEYVYSRPVEVTTTTIPKTDYIKSYTGIEGQSIYDVCIQVYGSLEKLVTLCFDNNQKLTNGDNVKNISFTYNTKKIDDVLLVNYFQTLGTGLGTYSLAIAKGKSYDQKAFDDSFN
jgi:hypothetical protein